MSLNSDVSHFRGAVHNSFTQFIGVSMTTAYAFNLMSRSYATYRGINLQLVVAFVPLSLAMVIAGGWYLSAIFVGILPLVLYMKGYSKRLRANFMAVVAAQRRYEMLGRPSRGRRIGFSGSGISVSRLLLPMHMRRISGGTSGPRLHRRQESRHRISLFRGT